MMQRTLSDEADICRKLAVEIASQPDRALLNCIAAEFDRLADIERRKDPSYYAVRAAQEVKAAVEAQHPSARLSHLVMAQRYDSMSRADA